ncbi:MAG TPA: tRNA glutamyl-Q(34) synthetase GluQRS [Burkholderiaceae bacterium]|nr:tRNA glutamyl-Q(34) synthetase GluQRS [Burkholderiaceae bacterium]
MPEAHPYRGRFAPSPTGPLHAGSLVAALASWLDARAHCGTWLVRIEDIDPPREEPGAAQDILATLSEFGLESDEPVVWQHARRGCYLRALAQLDRSGRIYACQCSRAQIAVAAAELGIGAGIYPGTCRDLRLARAPGRALRLRVDDAEIEFVDRACGAFSQQLARDVGDFPVLRADGLFAYQLAVVVDDAEQRITDVVRGADLLDNTPRQIALQRLLGAPQPRYLHVPVVRASDGEKLSKQNGAAALDRAHVLEELARAGAHLGVPDFAPDSRETFLRLATGWWRERWALTPTMPAKERIEDGR